MIEELSIISSKELSNVSENDVNCLVVELIDKSKTNMLEMCDLTLECTALLTSAQNRSDSLSNQGPFKRFFGEISGKNAKIRDAILEDNTNALYAAQRVINGVAKECMNNRELMIAVNDRLSSYYLELKEEQNYISEEVKKNRMAIIAFYKQFEEEIKEIKSDVKNIKEYEYSYCAGCNYKLRAWQIVCPSCGEIHSLKSIEMNEETRKILNNISLIVKDNTLSDKIVWDKTVQKAERNLRKVKDLAQTGSIDIGDEIENDLNTLINKCQDEEFQIAVVGVMKAGKSFLMNALIGAEAASVDVHPETATLTKFRAANGYYVKVRFNSDNQWEKLKASANESKSRGKDSLYTRLCDSSVTEMESEWINHDELFIYCNDLKELQDMVKKYTSSKELIHIFVSEVEVGIDRKIFDMPDEVVFVDTPGLQDPVKYRSDITKEYIKKADAVLIAVKPEMFTVESLGIISTVFEIFDNKKTYIVGTQKDLRKESECKAYVSNWIEKMCDSKYYGDSREAESRILFTSAKMSLLIKKWWNSSDVERKDQTFFNFDDYSDIVSFSGKVLKNLNFNVFQMTKKDYEDISRATGIEILRDTLNQSLIKEKRELKIDEIKRFYIRIKKQITDASRKEINERQMKIKKAVEGAESIKNEIEIKSAEKLRIKLENNELKQELKNICLDFNELFKDL